MKLSQNAENIYGQINPKTKLGDLRNMAKAIKKDHGLANELWSTKELLPRLLSILIMDHKALDLQTVANLFDDIARHEYDERLQLADWLLANQLTKNKALIAALESWQNHASAIQRRLFWYHQGRLRWVGQTPPANTDELLLSIERDMPNEAPEVQWAMNFTAGWIGIFDPTKRNRCIHIGEQIGLFRDEVVPRGCTPNYLPRFIEVEINKRKLV